MIAVLPRSDSQSTVRGLEYEDNDAVTNLPELARQAFQDFGFQHLQKNWRNDEASTNIDLFEAGTSATRYVQRVLTQDEICLVREENRGPLVLADLPTGIPGSLAPRGQFSFALKGSTSLQDALLETSLGDSTSTSREETISPVLREALDSLYGVKIAALEDDCDQPSDLAINNAEAVLRRMFTLSPTTYDIYPMVGGEIAIDAGNRGRRLGVFCYPDGRVQYVGLLGHDSEEIRQFGVGSIPLDFLRRFLSQPDP